MFDQFDIIDGKPTEKELQQQAIEEEKRKKEEVCFILTKLLYWVIPTFILQKFIFINLLDTLKHFLVYKIIY